MDLYKSIAPELAEVEKKIEGMLENEPEEVYGMLVPFVKSGGKRIRPALSMLSCRAVGGKCDKVLMPATLIEMFHNFTLVHDDIEDDSQFRRGEPTLHRKYGIPIALNSGDALYNLIWKHLSDLEIECEKYRTLHIMFSNDFKKVVEGQGLELDWEHNERFDITEEKYFNMIGKKTAALMGLSCETGAFIGDADKKTRKALRRFGEDIGVAFQIQDDVLNVTGDFEKYQKEIGGDITEGKRTLMVVHAMKHAEKEEKEKMISLLSSNSSRKEDIDYVIDVFKKYGSIDYAKSKAEEMIVDAKKQLEVLDDSDDKKTLESIADFVVKREK